MLLSKTKAFLFALLLLPASVLAQSVSAGISGPGDDVKGVPYKLTLDGRLPILFSGYIQFRYTDQNGTANPFQVKRLRFIADAQLTPDVDVYIQVDPTLSPNPLLDGYLQYKRITAARIRFGQFKVPFSGESLTADERTITIERSLVVNSFSPGRDNGQQGRDLGVQLLGNAGSEKGASVEYQLAFLNGSGIYNVQTNRQKAGAGRFLFHPIEGASVGGDYYQGEEPLAGAPAASTLLVVKQRQDLEAGYVKGHFTSWGEYLWGHDGTTNRSGGYGMLAYKFNHHWESWVRAQDYDANHEKTHSITRQYDGGLNYYFTSLIRAQAAYGTQKSPVTGKLGQVFLAQVQAEF